MRISMEIEQIMGAVEDDQSRGNSINSNAIKLASMSVLRRVKGSGRYRECHEERACERVRVNERLGRVGVVVVVVVVVEVRGGVPSTTYLAVSRRSVGGLVFLVIVKYNICNVM